MLLSSLAIAALALACVTAAVVRVSGDYVLQWGSVNRTFPGIQIEAGTTVTWITNLDYMGHTITSANLTRDGIPLFNSGIMTVNDTFSYTFGTEGRYLYEDALVGNVGAVHVVDKQSSTTSTLTTTLSTTSLPLSTSTAAASTTTTQSIDVFNGTELYLAWGSANASSHVTHYIKIGTTVYFETILDGNEHTVTSVNLTRFFPPSILFYSDILYANNFFNYTFTRPGWYPFYDAFNDSAHGLIVVIAPPPTPPGPIHKNKLTLSWGSANT